MTYLLFSSIADFCSEASSMKRCWLPKAIAFQGMSEGMKSTYKGSTRKTDRVQFSGSETMNPLSFPGKKIKAPAMELCR